ncbi:hypothetical protein [Anaerosphaera multitolerans]|uniref:Uncharacterized protein n=1 Tax=Anaerosphaera multitolerans TaxID=2487351 RepID=A0A437S8U7_9FIRM|nr:hypothetical protein [Anaerosphaera multitolerans]RVU55258.1 hypothetical protein EF514_03025 [Anaerosphaera multitolerans]
MKENNFLNIISKVTLGILIISILIFGFSFFSYSNMEDIEKDNKKLKNDLTQIVESEIEIKEKYNETMKAFEEIELEFTSKYGYDYTMGDEDVIESEIENLKSKNSSIKIQLKEEIKKYKDYYSGDYYLTETLDNSISKFVSLNSINDVDELNPDLYSYLELEKFMEEAIRSGTVKYLISLNKRDIKFDILAFTTAMYSDKLYEIGNDLSDIDQNLNKLYSQIVGLTEVYRNMETFGIKTGKLSYGNLLNLKKNSLTLIEEYFKNKGTIEFLESLGEENEKSK